MLQTETSTRIYKARPMNTKCCGFVRNPDWLIETGAVKLLHCTGEVTDSLTILDGGVVETRSCCDCHAEQLRAMEKAGRIEILSDEPKEMAA